MPLVANKVSVRQHPGSSQHDIDNEPEWGAGHQHRVGYRNRQDRRPGITHAGDEREDDAAFRKRALQELQQLHDEIDHGKLINFRDAVTQQEDFHLRHPGVHSAGWRYVLKETEDWIKNAQDWPINVQKRKHEEENKQKSKQKGDEVQQKNVGSEHEWKRQGGQNKHHDAYPGSAAGDREGSPNGEAGNEKHEETESDVLQEKYSPQEIALLRSLRHEKEYISKLKQNDGKHRSPVAKIDQLVSIDEADQFCPDNWIPRSEDLIRLTGKHPLNAEPDLTRLFEAGMITPNELHYVRNHGHVPHLLWETHQVEVEGGKLVLSMDQLKNDFESFNIPVALACDGNRRKELNLIKRSKGFSWGSGAVSCAYWKGPLLRDILLKVGVPDTGSLEKSYWVNFEGCDELSEGKYATCIPLPYAMDPENDVILAYEMNDVPLPPDHGHPVRLMIPGYIGGRCIKWLKKIWISEKENDSHYHIWDNRVLPSFVTEMDGEFAETMFAHPDTACNEQNLNSVIVKPKQGEQIDLTTTEDDHTYTIEGYAYDGGGHEVQRVEVTLDEGETWLYCIRKFPEAPIRHGKRFWTWLHWHLDVKTSHLIRAKGIAVRCFNVFKNTQPEKPSWNVMGMMNNCWYTVKLEVVEGSSNGRPSILFRHPTEPGTGTGGWMQSSAENRIEDAKQSTGTPEKQFTREEIEKHDTENDCWIVVDSKVYDATSVLSWHPGGKAAVMGHAGQVHQETTEEFSSIHDGYAYKMLNECILGSVTDKVKKYIQQSAQKAATEKAQSAGNSKDIALQKHRWTPVRLIHRKPVSNDTRRYTFSLPPAAKTLGLATCQHIQLGFHFPDRMLIRSYTPTRPILPSKQDDDTFDLVVKTYFPDANQPGGAMSNILDTIPLGEEIEIRGPTGEITYKGNGDFDIEGQHRHFDHITLILGGSGITPGYALIVRVLETQGDVTAIRVIDANKSEVDILLKDEIDDLVQKYGGGDRFRVEHVLSHPGDEWKGTKGHVDAQVIRKNGFEPDKSAVAFLCGPPAMIQKAALPALTAWGYKEEENCFGF